MFGRPAPIATGEDRTIARQASERRAQDDSRIGQSPGPVPFRYHGMSSGEEPIGSALAVRGRNTSILQLGPSAREVGSSSMGRSSYHLRRLTPMLLLGLSGCTGSPPGAARPPAAAAPTAPKPGGMTASRRSTSIRSWPSITAASG